MSDQKLHGKDPVLWTKPIPNTHFDVTPVKHLVASLDRLHCKGQFIEIDHQKQIPDLEYVKINNHFQGIQRTRNSNYILITGASKKSTHAHLFVIKINGDKQKAFGSNILIKGKEDYGSLVDVFCLAANPYWHAGGLSICGDIMCVPLEGDGRSAGKSNSRIAFYNIKNPTEPIKYPTEIFRANQKAGASCLIRMPDKHFHCAVWSDSDHLPKRFDLYRSKTQNLQDGFLKYKRISIDQVLDRTGRQPRFQTIQFMRDESGEVYIIGFLNTRKTAPIINGTNKLFVYKLGFDQAHKIVGMNQIYARQFDDGRSYYNMGAATGGFVNSKGSLSLYSAHHWKTRKFIRLAEFEQSIQDPVRGITSIKSAQIECWEHEYFEGRYFILQGDNQMSIPSFKQLRAQGKKFNDKLSSLRILLPKTHKIKLYQHESFKGESIIFKGTGKLMEVPQLETKNDQISSLKIE
jgi:hypothetical protein